MNYISNDGESWGYEEERDARNDYLNQEDREPEPEPEELKTNIITTDI